jgi:diguanylate cyclase (GGDEF)-like protein
MAAGPFGTDILSMALFRPDLLGRAAAHPVAGRALTVVGATVGFVAVALLGFQVVDAGSGLVAFWPPNGLVVALFVLLPPRLRLWALLAVLPGELIADSIHGYPLPATLGFAVTDLLESAIAGVILLKLARRAPRGDRQRDFYALLVAAGVAPLISGLLGAEISHLEWGSPYETSLLLWWFGDMTGILLVVSLAMSISGQRLRATGVHLLGAVAEVAIVVAAALAIFGLTTLPIGFLVFAPLTLLAIRQGLRPTAVATLAFAVIAALMTGRGHGPFTGVPNTTLRVFLLQIFIALTSFIAFLISATMSERRHAEATLVDLATHDPLTGLPNRRLFLSQLEGAAARTTRSVESTAIVYLDLDGFKEINDRFGHAIGDEVLVEVGRRLAAGARAGDLVARLGGDEFAGLLEPVEGIEGAGLSARRIADLIEQPFHLGELVVPIRVSVGAALVTADVDLSLRQADEALYRDKRGDAVRTRPAGLSPIAGAAV